MRSFARVMLLSLWLAAAAGAQAQQAWPLPPVTPSDSVTPTAYAGDESSLAEEVAELKAWRKKTLEKEAEAAKKAAAEPSVKISGRAIVDTAMFDQNDASRTQVGDAENGTEFRAARLCASGAMFHVIDYKLEFDFATSTRPAFKDVYMGVHELPLLGNVRIGHFKEPFGMEQLESAKYLTFMERSLGDQGVFVPGRNVGVMTHRMAENERATFAIGAFTSEIAEDTPVTRYDHAGTAATMRLTWLPWYDEATEGRGLWHTGVAYSYRAIGDETVQLRATPEAHLGPYIVDTGVLNVDEMQLVGGETAFVYGPFSAQGELYHAKLDPTTAGLGNAELNGGYVYVSYFLTGEHRPYKREAGTFDRVKPFENFFRVRGEDGCVHTGKGAWELAYRFSYVDLNDGFVEGGRAADHTIGLNWYLTPYTRLMFNYIRSCADRPVIDDGLLNVFQMRAQVDF